MTVPKVYTRQRKKQEKCKVAPLSRLVGDRLWLKSLGGISKVHTYCGSAYGCTALTGNYEHHLDDEKNDLHSKNDIWPSFENISPSELSEMIIISSFQNDGYDRHLKKPFRFILDLWRIYPFIFKWQYDLLFGMKEGIFIWQSLLPHFGSRGDLPLVISVRTIIFFIIEKGV